MIRIISSGAIAMLAISCTDRTGIPIESNELGIARVDIERSSTRDKQLSIVRGLDAGGDEVVALTILPGSDPVGTCSIKSDEEHPRKRSLHEGLAVRMMAGHN